MEMQKLIVLDLKRAKGKAWQTNPAVDRPMTFHRSQSKATQYRRPGSSPLSRVPGSTRQQQLLFSLLVPGRVFWEPAAFLRAGGAGRLYLATALKRG